MRYKNFTASLNRLIAVADWWIVNPVSVFHAGAHLLGNLPSVLLPLQGSLRCHDGFNELTFRRLIELEVQTFDLGTAQTEGFSQIEMETRITGKAFEIIEDHNKALIRLSIEKAQKCDHTGTLHKVSATCDRIREDRRNIIAFCSGMLTTTGFLRLEAVAFTFLRARGHPAVNDSLCLVCVLTCNGKLFCTHGGSCFVRGFLEATVSGAVVSSVMYLTTSSKLWSAPS
ncbi:MAG: hypothetical protein AAFX62_05215 [Pseudomonadota bacterium]